MKSEPFSNRVERLLVRLASVEKAITFVAFMLLILAVFADVVSRELTGTGLHWARQGGVYANLFVVMFGLGLASAGGSHLRPRFADGWLPERLAPLLERANDLGMAAFCVAFAVIATGVVVDSFGLQERSVALRIAIWPFQAVIPLAFAIGGVRHLAYATFPELRPPDVGALATDVEEAGTAG
ncbi:MAG: TRAP transporter small permease [Gammaproteobacteria bacterium]